MENTKLFKEFNDEWVIVDRDEEFFLVSKKGGSVRRVVSVLDNELGEVFIDVLDVKGLLDQDEDVIDFMLGYSYSEDEFEEVKKELYKDKEENSNNNIPMFCELKSHGYGDFVAADSLLYDEDDVSMWFNSNKIIESIKSCINK